jgi:hypothetical protein
LDALTIKLIGEPFAFDLDVAVCGEAGGDDDPLPGPIPADVDREAFAADRDQRGQRGRSQRATASSARPARNSRPKNRRTSGTAPPPR